MDFWQRMRQKLNVQFEEREVKGKWLLACLNYTTYNASRPSEQNEHNCS